MKPRIFISSTFYDLKYIREDLANFVRSYSYEPVLFEDGDIGYTPGRNLDNSCYESMKNSDMVILIIGGEYGSPASGEIKDEFQEYMSVTRNEFRTAIESGIPIFVMIDKKVMVEYGVYDANYDEIERENRKMAFPTTKNINVFRFIKEIKEIVTLPIQEFEQSSDIKGFISKQWADMFKNFLNILRDEKENKKIESSVNEMKWLIQKMDIMLDSVGKKLLSKEDPGEYEDIINQQEITTFCNTFLQGYRLRLNLYVKWNEDGRRRIIEALLEMVKNAAQVEGDDFFIADDELNKSYAKFRKNYGRLEPLGPILPKKLAFQLLSDENNFNRILTIMSEEKYYNRFVI